MNMDAGVVCVTNGCGCCVCVCVCVCVCMCVCVCSTYRKAELAVAQTVTLLSQHPSDPKLLKKVHKLVKEAQTDRRNMEKDHTMLSTLEEKIASLQVLTASLARMLML